MSLLQTALNTGHSTHPPPPPPASAEDVERCIKVGYKDKFCSSTTQSAGATTSSSSCSPGFRPSGALVKKTVDKNRTLARRRSGAEDKDKTRRCLNEDFDKPAMDDEGDMTPAGTECEAPQVASQAAPQAGLSPWPGYLELKLGKPAPRERLGVPQQMMKQEELT